MKREVTLVPEGRDSRSRDSAAGRLQSGPMEEGRPTSKVRVLVGSTDTRVRKLVCSTLSRDKRFEVVAQVADGGSVITSAEAFDAAVVDVAISGLGILGVMSGLHGPMRSPAVPMPSPAVIVVSRTDAIYLRHACLAEGAADYLVLPDALFELPDHVAQAVQTSTTLTRSE